MSSVTSFLVFLFGVVCLGGCTPTVHTPSLQGPTSTASVRPTNSEKEEVPFGGEFSDDGSTDLERLAQLWHRRTQEGASADYPIGPGDVLEISVPHMEELESRTVRVSGEGTISLPFTGIVPVMGLTEREVKAELRQRLTKYKRDPQISLFVREYRSRLVAVAGAVGKPGLYSLASSTDTLLDMISQAGGMTKEAFPRILLTPAESAGSEQTDRFASTVPAPQGEGAPASLTEKNANPIVIDLKSLRKGSNQIYLTLPARPGDSIFVPSGGEVLVGGWVDKPGSYPITAGMTVLGAVAAAGDTLFPADTGAVKIFRTGKGGEKIFLSADLKKITNGESSDIPVQEGDIIEVASSTPKLVSYGMFNFFRTVLHVGTQFTPY
jgi:polysaccharide export outer membrane protein